MTINEKAYGAWLDECQEMWDAIYLRWIAETTPKEIYDFMLATYVKAARPYHYFLESHAEKQMLEESGKGGESVSGISEGERTNRKDIPPAVPEISPPHPAHVFVTGETLANKEWLRGQRLKWAPSKKGWYGSVNDLAVFQAEADKRKLVVKVEGA